MVHLWKPHRPEKSKRKQIFIAVYNTLWLGKNPFPGKLKHERVRTLDIQLQGGFDRLRSFQVKDLVSIKFEIGGGNKIAHFILYLQCFSRKMEY